jgi:hypothetical protein
MEKFKIEISRLRKEDGKMFIVFDVKVGNTKVGEAETDYATFHGLLLAKVHEFATLSMTEDIKALLAAHRQD